MKYIAIIPARAGSKSIPNKNLQKLGGKTLVHKTLDSAKESGLFEKIIVTTDIPVLIEEFSADKDVTLLPRKEALCTDTSLMNETVLDALTRTEASPIDMFWLLQPTSPFRTIQDFKSVDSLLAKHRPMSLISVKDVGGAHPNRTYTIVRNELKPLRFTNFDNKQTLKSVYLRNGCFYVCHVGQFKKVRNFYLDPCVPYVMPEDRSINIDGPLDLLLAKAVAKGQQVA